MKKETLERKAANQVAAWERFCESEKGVFPPMLAAAYLKITVQGVHSASERGWIKYILVGRERFYSRKDCVSYRWTGSRKFADNHTPPPYKGFAAAKRAERAAGEKQLPVS